MTCIFCKIAKGEIPSETVFEDGELKVFRDIHPKAPVHFLAIPKEHIESVAQLEERHEKIAGKLLFVAKEVARSQGLKGYKLLLNVGREGGQEVDHLHLHIMGGWDKRNGELT